MNRNIIPINKYLLIDDFPEKKYATKNIMVEYSYIGVMLIVYVEKSPLLIPNRKMYIKTNNNP
ncbi:hypothetical protein GCM10008986_09920 [Salinibacillus aidingensis]|uniref:Uncharacterized protein n=1 Tax=Salinibacillus aidingensis TaxID=237684 RepID=A0ABN1AYI3_9BACI